MADDIGDFFGPVTAIGCSKSCSRCKIHRHVVWCRLVSHKIIFPIANFIRQIKANIRMEIPSSDDEIIRMPSANLLIQIAPPSHNMCIRQHKRLRIVINGFSIVGDICTMRHRQDIRLPCRKQGRRESADVTVYLRPRSVLVIFPVGLNLCCHGRIGGNNIINQEEVVINSTACHVLTNNSETNRPSIAVQI